MNFLSELNSVSTRDYEKLGYLHNPFPIKGEVRPEIYVERPELKRLRQHLIDFLSDKGNNKGGVWAVEGGGGVGKSNFLQHLAWELREAQLTGKLEHVAYQYVPSQLIAPQQLIENIIQAIGEEIFCQLLSERPELPHSSKGTDLYRFFKAIRNMHSSLNSKGLEYSLKESARFLMRWLSGHQTYVQDREQYQIWSQERMPPAVAFPYLRKIMDCLESHNLLKKLILLLDEFEDVQSLKPAAKSEYIQALKGLINTFNGESLFVILAGREGSFTIIGEQYPSIASRWQLAPLSPITSANDAVKLAKAYQAFAHDAYLKQHKEDKEADQKQRLPNEDQIKIIYADIKEARIPQRDMLQALYQWVEKWVEDHKS